MSVHHVTLDVRGRAGTKYEELLVYLRRRVAKDKKALDALVPELANKLITMYDPAVDDPLAEDGAVYDDFRRLTARREIYDKFVVTSSSRFRPPGRLTEGEIEPLYNQHWDTSGNKGGKFKPVRPELTACRFPRRVRSCPGQSKKVVQNCKVGVHRESCEERYLRAPRWSRAGPFHVVGWDAGKEVDSSDSSDTESSALSTTSSAFEEAQRQRSNKRRHAKPSKKRKQKVKTEERDNTQLKEADGESAIERAGSAIADSVAGRLSMDPEPKVEIDLHGEISAYSEQLVSSLKKLPEAGALPGMGVASVMARELERMQRTLPDLAQRAEALTNMPGACCMPWNRCMRACRRRRRDRGEQGGPRGRGAGGEEGKVEVVGRPAAALGAHVPVVSRRAPPSPPLSLSATCVGGQLLHSAADITPGGTITELPTYERKAIFGIFRQFVHELKSELNGQPLRPEVCTTLDLILQHQMIHPTDLAKLEAVLIELCDMGLKVPCITITMSVSECARRTRTPSRGA